MLKTTSFIVLAVLLLSSVAFADNIPIRKDSKGNEYKGCIVQLKQQPVLDITADEEQYLSALDYSQLILEEGLETALQKNNVKDIKKLSAGVAVILNEEKSTIAEEKKEVADQLHKIKSEHEQFLKALEAETPKITGQATHDSIVEEELFLGLNGFLLDVDERQCETIKNVKGATGTALNYIEYSALKESLPLMCDGNEQGTDNSCSVWSLKDVNNQDLTGKGITVAVIDTGIDYAHADFGGCSSAQITDSDLATCPKIVGGWDFYNGDSDPMDSDPCSAKEVTDGNCPDQNKRFGGHGTHVASTIAGNGKASGGLNGVAPGAKLIIFKTLGGARGSGASSDRIKALGCATGVIAKVDDVIKKVGVSISQDETAVCAKLGKADIASLSLAVKGSDPVPAYDPTKCDSDAAAFTQGEILNCPVDRAVKNGVIVVVAAGNFGPNQGTIGNPGTSVKAITVGNSCDRAFNFQGGGSCAVDGLSPSSSRGPTTEGRMKPDVTAPGTFVTAAWPAGVDRASCKSFDDATHCTIAGTSMATPHVSGVVALMLQKNPGLKPEDVKDILMRTAKNAVGGAAYGTAGYDTDPLNFNDGAGRVNVLAAINAVASPTATGGSGSGTGTGSGTGSGSGTGGDSGTPTTSQPAATVPQWAQKWAQEPRGISVAPLKDGKFEPKGELSVAISGFDIVWSKGYRADAKYVIETISKGQQFDASKVWLPFDVSAKKQDGSSLTVSQGWILTAKSDVLTTSVPITGFELNAERYNAVALFACKVVGPKEGFVEYDCNSLDSKLVQVRQDGLTTAESGRGSWLLKDFELGVGDLLPPPPGLPGVVTLPAGTS